MCRGVEIDEVAAPHIDRAHAKTYAVGVDAIEIDQLFKRQPEAAGIVITRCLHGAWRIQPWRWSARSEEPGRAANQSEIGAHLVLPLPHRIAFREEQALTPITIRFGRDALPERTQ